MSSRLENMRQRTLDASRRLSAREGEGAWRRERFVLPRSEARQKAREFLQRFPKAAYASEVEEWRVLDDGRIEFTMRRLPTAD